ncbi:hypothetical protein UPYG_G00329060 [Umbra pygmaea]|uniref:Ig-like domain-containing protein n=1 Tax=Umbra pygmaea TaxID=75934 RepID=A0ABD0W1Q7_UMBPY
MYLSFYFSSDVLMFFFSLTLMFSVFSLTLSDEDFGYIDSWCRIKSRDLHDVEYMLDHHINKEMVAQYNSTTKRWTGYTDYGKQSADIWNNDPREISRREIERITLCNLNGPELFDAVEAFMVPPNVTLRQEGPSSNPTLVCSVHYFYPKHIKVTWQKNGQEVTSNVMSTGELANGFWSYQIQSHLKYSPVSGDRFSCMVEHMSLPEPRLYYWEPTMSGSDRMKIFIGFFGLILGLAFLVLGFICWKTSAGRPLEPTDNSAYASING